MTYLELKQFILSKPYFAPFASEVEGWIELARTRINRDLRAREQITVTDVSPTSIPFSVSDLLEVRDLSYARGVSRVSLRLSPRWRMSQYESSQYGGPQFYSVDGTDIWTAPGGTGTEFRLIYYAAVPKLENDSDTNALLETYPTLWTHGAMIEGFNHIQDFEAQGVATQIYTSEKDLVNAAAHEAESGAALQMTGASSWL